MLPWTKIAQALVINVAGSPLSRVSGGKNVGLPRHSKFMAFRRPTGKINAQIAIGDGDNKLIRRQPQGRIMAHCHVGVGKGHNAGFKVHSGLIGIVSCF